MSERIDKLMQAAGLKETVLNSLERGDSIFVLTDQTLLFQDGGGTRRVTLRDLKRIHSDQEGLLRVETPAGTALTANLLGFDPAAVQSFFAQVRDATARAKQRPLATDSGPVASGPAPETSNVNAQKAVPVSPAVTPAPTPPAAPAANNPLGQPTAEPSAGAKWTGSERSAPAPAAPGAASAVGAERPAAPVTPSAPFPSAPPARLIVSPVQPVSPTALNAAATAPAAGNGLSTAPAPAPTPTPVTAAPTAPSWKPQEAPVTMKPVVKAVRTPTVITDPEVLSRPEAAPQADKPHVETAPVQPEPPAARRVNGTAAGSLASLAAVAGGVSAWVGALKAMSLVMLLATFGMAYFQYDKGQGINGFWTLIAGGMGAVALWALSDLVKLLVALAQAVSAEGGVMDVD